ncbi:hypothetical protein EDB85DRAFT_2141375 [Lactarius pseudohatsudake]|nr:hypothetical protein EDB85DRAFT_2141375 [Lactarius pseudohatsudake]
MVEHSAETTAPVAEGSSITEQATLATIETTGNPQLWSLLPHGSPLEADTPAETPAPVGEPVPVPEESKGTAARSTEEYAPPAAEHLSDQPEPLLKNRFKFKVTEQVVQEPVIHIDGEIPQATEEEPVVQKPEKVDAPVETPVSNGTGHEPEQKLEAEPDPAVPDEKLDDAA